MMVVYVVMIQDELGEHTTIHSVFTNESEARKECQQLESRLNDDMIVRIEAHEVVE